MSNNYYDTLGVNKSASTDEIKRAFRKKAHEFHPDKGGGNAEKFKEINEAYQVLSDSQKKQQYDTYGQTFEQAQRNGGGFSGGARSPFGGGDPFADFSGFGNGGIDFDLGDIFGDIFGSQQERSARRNRGIDLEMGISVSFEEAIFGATKNIILEKQDACKACGGNGAEKGSKIVSCPKCHGAGQIVTIRRTIFGQVQSRVSCDRCEGTGKMPESPCRSCGGSGIKRQEKELEVKIPAGIDNGQRIRIAGEGEMGYRGTNPGDLYLVVRVGKSKDFIRDGFTLLKDLPVSFTQAALGTKIIVKTLDGDIELKIPTGTQSGTVFKVKGKGVPYLQRSGRGDLLITARVVVPTKLSKKEKEILKSLAQEQGETVEIDESLWNEIKNSFN
jgi:molecular chaperone DnaJ